LTNLKPFRDSQGAPGDTLAVRFLEEDGQNARDVAGWMAEFIDETRESLDLAFYDVRLDRDAANVLRDALRARIAAGVRVRLVYDSGGKPQTPSNLDVSGADYAPLDTHDRVQELGLPDKVCRGVSDIRGLMHHKYLIRDGSDIWTGSINITNDSMGRQENIAVILTSRLLADLYTRDFEQLWSTRRLEATGAFRTDPDSLTFDGKPASTDVDFSPGQGEQINELVASRVMRARRRIVICSMLFTSSKLLNALTSQLDRGDVALSGVFDGTQMAEVLGQWRERSDLDWKIAAVQRVVEEGRLVGKQSQPYRPGQSHNFMHNKTLVIDDTVITGSYNLSHAAQGNAENMLAIDSSALAERVVAYIDHLQRRYASPD
jgi:phosphatidylserine/phosphatidylglycerophosphate/cardiolipin synthase-like enzyme